MGSTAARSGTWDEASSPAATRLARQFEGAWRASKPGRRPDPLAFLANSPDASAACRLALLRADLNLKWDEGEAVRVETYRDRRPGLDPDTLVALCYEEFCRREEDGEGPFPAEYDERFPDLADRLRRVFDIHELIGNAASTDLHVPETPPVPFPEAGQTIAGFHLVEELGRGSFARVFLARERQLADRPVALKVARAGSREPQTLARLQHTNIVPVHSCRTDPATGLHLMCMPYFGRVTLAGLLADPGARVAATGSGLLDALDRLDPPDAGSRGSSSRATLAGLSFARAIAWWGARLAEALGHAHDRGILHRDIKPSNVLVTGDGLPMLLDFNLAGESLTDRGRVEPETLGGTVAYMAPEHLEAVARRDDDRLDRRSDVYSLGVLLFEALTGSRPFPGPGAMASMPEVLRRAAEGRRGPPPRLRPDHPEVPAALERVIRRCLEPDPAARFPTAADLAADLQAVADDVALRSTREPIPVRLGRTARRSWKRLALAVPIAATVAALAGSTLREGSQRARLEVEAAHLLGEGKRALRGDDFAVAEARLADLERMTRGRPELAGYGREARAYHASARESRKTRDRADAFHRDAERLRPRLLAREPSPGDAAAVEAALAPFRVLADPTWARSPDLTWLDARRKARLLQDAEELLFLHAVRLDPRDGRAARVGLTLSDRGLSFTETPAPWRALRSRFDDSPAPNPADDPRTETSGRACFEWAVLLDRQGRAQAAADWLGRAASLRPDDPWYAYQLATLHARAGRHVEAIRHLGEAIALDPSSAPIRREWARVLRSLGDRARDLDDEGQAGAR